MLTDGEIIKTDVSIAKNYLRIDEIKSLDRFVTMYLDYAEKQAERKVPMSNGGLVWKIKCFFAI